MTPRPPLAASALVVCALLACSRRVDAMEPPEDGASFDEVRAYENRLRPFTVLADVTMVLTARISFEGQFVPWMHHGFRLNPFCAFVDQSLPFISGAADERFQLSCGTEVGYRYYTGERGANGFFVGPSLLFAHTHVNAGNDASKQPVGARDFYYAGGALDVGVQGMTERGFTVGGGAGVVLLRNLDAGSRFGVDQRLFINVGYSFP